MKKKGRSYSGLLFKLIAGAALMLGDPAIGQQQQAGTISGRVIDATEAVVPDASVVITGRTGSPAETTTATDGSFQITGLEAGTYGLRVTRKGLGEYEQQVKMAAGQTIQLTIMLQPSTLSQTVEVVASADPVSGSVTKWMCR
jgi:hypothetical protein